MTTLLDRLRAADGPNRELDWAISEHLGDIPEHKFVPKGEVQGGWGSYRHEGSVTVLTPEGAEGRTHSKWSPPRYTASIDTALTLFCDRVVSWQAGDSPGGPTAWVLLNSGTKIYAYPDPGKGTPATCLCIAAIQARESNDGR